MLVLPKIIEFSDFYSIQRILRLYPYNTCSSGKKHCEIVIRSLNHSNKIEVVGGTLRYVGNIAWARCFN